MRTFLSYIILCFLTISAHAQKYPDYNWGKFGGGADLATDKNNNIYAVGSFEDTIFINNKNHISKGQSDILLSKYDNIGNILWTKQFGSNFLDEVHGICTDDSNNVYISGIFYSSTVFDSDTIKGGNRHSAFLVKLNNSGSTVWTKAIGSYGTLFSLNSLATDDSNNIYLCAYLAINIGDTFTIGNYIFPGNNSDDIFLFKYSSTGNLIWAIREGGPNSDRPFGLTFNNKSLYMTGQFRDSTNFGTVLHPKGSMYIAKYSTNGKLITLSKPDIGNYGLGLDITSDDHGNVYMCGGIEDSTVWGGFQLYPTGARTPLIIKCDSNLNIMWAKLYPTTQHSIANNIKHFSGYVYTSIYTSDATLAQYDDNGTLKWSNEFGPHVFPPTIEGLTISNQGRALITGTYDNNCNIYGKDTLENTYNITGPSCFIAEVNQPANNILSEQVLSKGSISIYPNPTDGGFNLFGDISSFTHYDIINITGQIVVKRKRLLANKISDLHNKPAGNYHIRLYNKEGLSSTHIIVKE